MSEAKELLFWTLEESQVLLASLRMTALFS